MGNMSRRKEKKYLIGTLPCSAWKNLVTICTYHTRRPDEFRELMVRQISKDRCTTCLFKHNPDNYKLEGKSISWLILVDLLRDRSYPRLSHQWWPLSVTSRTVRPGGTVATSSRFVLHGPAFLERN